jgi:transcriptional regulator with PAS, ATPase and Fis domain
LLFSGGGLVAGHSRALIAGGGDVIIGREASPGGVALPEDVRASRRHAVVRRGPEGVSITDVGSKNGTFVNGRRVAEAALADGDVVRVGDSLLLLRHQPAEALDAAIPSLLGEAPVMGRLRHALSRVGPTAATVLLLGESGTGKELCARALHDLGRPGGPFIAVNCAAIPEGLAESQLFGHLGGAFTGAKEQPGFFRAAHGGTLFLDELGELAGPLQAKLLRALEERAVVPVGGTRPIPCDVRLVAATHRDLAAEVEAGRFRGDLYARLCEVPISLPPLRARREDILPLLAQALDDSGPQPRLTAALAEALLLYPWPYNVREVLKIAAQLRLVGPGEMDLDEVAERLLRKVADAPREGEAGDEGEEEAAERGRIPGREELEALLRAHRGVIRQVALATGRSRRQVARWLEQHQLDAEDYRR